MVPWWPASFRWALVLQFRQPSRTSLVIFVAMILDPEIRAGHSRLANRPEREVLPAPAFRGSSRPPPARAIAIAGVWHGGCTSIRYGRDRHLRGADRS